MIVTILDVVLRRRTATALRGNEDRSQTPLNPRDRLRNRLLIALILIAIVAIAALELWAFWALGEHDDRRRRRHRKSQAGLAEIPFPASRGRPRRTQEPRPIRLSHRWPMNLSIIADEPQPEQDSDADERFRWQQDVGEMGCAPIPSQRLVRHSGPPTRNLRRSKACLQARNIRL
jgi:hypothetical protein